MPKDNRDIRVSGKRKAFEVGRFVLAIMVHAEALAEAEANDANDRSATKASPSSDGTSTIWQRPGKGRTASSSPAGGRSDQDPSPNDTEAV